MIDDLPQFDVSGFRFNQHEQPMITLLKMDTLRQSIYVGTRQAWLYKLNSKFSIMDSLHVGSAPPI